MLFHACTVALLWLVACSSAARPWRRRHIGNEAMRKQSAINEARHKQSAANDKQPATSGLACMSNVDDSDASSSDLPSLTAERWVWKDGIVPANVAPPENEHGNADVYSSLPRAFSFYVSFDGPAVENCQNDFLGQVFGASNLASFQSETFTLWKECNAEALVEGAFYQMGYLLSTTSFMEMRFSLLREGVSVNLAAARHGHLYYYSNFTSSLAVTLVARDIFMRARKLKEFNGIALGRRTDGGFRMAVLGKKASTALYRIVHAALNANREDASQLDSLRPLADKKVPDEIFESWLLAHR
jgi:hypothetical protein